MLRKFSTSFLAIMTIGSFAYGQEATSQGNSTNFILVDYGFNLTSDADIKDTMTLGTGGEENNESSILF